MIEINNKKLCESCFAETDSEICSKCGFDRSEYITDPLVLPMGTKLNDKIVIGRVMGKGGFGVTYLGYDLRMDKTIAVKEYYPNGIAYRSPSGTEVSVADAKSSETFEKGAEKFYTEAQMVAQFNGNPNIVSVYDYFRANNTVYLIMEYLSGITLKTYVKKHGRLTDGQALFVMDKIAAALSITHSAGVLHRDISPDNIMICIDGKVKLIDFGAARQIMAESSSNLTVVMKPGYTPIEQYTKKGKQGAWTDIYSLGVSIYYAMTEVIIDDPYARMDSDDEFADNKHGINEVLWGILKKCTMINSSDRYGSAIDLRKALSSVSAPIKSEPITLNEDDLRADDSNNTSYGTSANVSAEEDFPVTAAADENREPEVIEIFENGNTVAPKEDGTEAAIVAPAQNDSPAKEKSGSKKIIIGSVCAAVVILAGIIGVVFAVNKPDDSEKITANVPNISETTAGTREIISETQKAQTTSPKTEKPIEKNEVSKDVHKTVVLDNNDMVWGLLKSISKSVLNDFDGDVRITLKTKYMDVQRNDDGNYYHCIKILNGSEEVLNVNAPALKKDEYDNFPVEEDGMDFVFVIPKFFAEHVKDKIYFETENVMIKSAILEDDTYDKTIELDGEYPGDWSLMNYTIPFKELESYDSDVRITLDVEVGTFGNGENLFVDENTPISLIMPVVENWIHLDVEADNLPAVNDDEMYAFIGEGKRTFSFTVSKDEINKYCSNGMCFQVYNLVVKNAYIKGVPEESAE